MKIISSNFKKGFVKIKIDIDDDLWILKNILEIGDLVKSRTMRSTFINRDGQKIKTGKKPMILQIQLEKIQFDKYTYRLRLGGKIIQGPEGVELSSYHTIEVEPGSILSIEKKEWRRHQIEKIKKARARVPSILIVVVDSNQATFGLLKRSSLNVVSELSNPYSVVHEEEKLPEFYKKISKEIDKFSQEVKKIILAGPGFTKEHVQKIIQKNYPETSSKLIVNSTSSATESGINEILKRGTLDKIIIENEIVNESKLIEEFFTHLKKEDGLGIYGFENIKQASETGAIETLLVSDKKIHEEEVEKLANGVERKKGQVEIISTNHDSGEQFYRMGGLGAILRFRIF